MGEELLKRARATVCAIAARCWTAVCSLSFGAHGYLRVEVCQKKPFCATGLV